MKPTRQPNPYLLLSLMVEGVIPYEAKAAHDAAIEFAGGPTKSLVASLELVELAFQLEALALALDMGQPANMVERYRTHARKALRDLQGG